MKIAITAASGNLGKAIVKQLLKELNKDQIIMIARSPEKVNFPEHISWADYFQQSSNKSRGK